MQIDGTVGYLDIAGGHGIHVYQQLDLNAGAWDGPAN